MGSAIVTWRNCTTEEQHWEERQTRLQLTLDRATQATRILVQELGREPLTPLLIQGKAVFLDGNLSRLILGAITKAGPTKSNSRTIWPSTTDVPN